MAGAIAALIVGVVGWVVAGKAIESVTATLDPISRIVVNVADSVEASEVIFDRTREAVEAIETATRSTVRTLNSLGDVLSETAALAGGGVADSLDSAVDTLPGLISTARVIDRTMSTLSLVGVDYDPEVPLDRALADLQSSLQPLPDQVREQVELIGSVQTDLDRIADDARGLSAVLLETRLDMQSAGRVLASASANAAAAAESVETIRTDVDSYSTMARVGVVAATVALLAGAMAPLLLGVYLRRTAVDPGRPERLP